MNNHSLRFEWARFFPPPEVERDPGFRALILRHTRYGMAGLGVLGIVSVLLFLGVRSFSAQSVGWSYDADAVGQIVLWDKVCIIMLSATCLILSRSRFGPRSGRLLVAALAVAAAVALLLDDLRVGDLSFSPAYLSLVMLGAVGTMPYRPAQIFALCVTIIGVFLYFMAWHSAIQGFGWWSIDPTRARFLVVVTPICTIISALIYSSRYELYKSRRRAEELKAQVREKSDELLRLERETAQALEHSFRKLKTLQSQLVHQGKMASLGRLTAGIAHEIRNPLNFVVNYASLSSGLTEGLLQSITSNYDRRLSEVAGDLSAVAVDLQHNAEKINAHGRRAAAIVENMLRHSRVTSGERREIDLNALIDEHVRLAYHAMRAQHPGFDVIIEDEYDEEVGIVEAAPQEIGRVILNLLENAFYALREKAAVSGPDYEPTIGVSTRRLEDSVQIHISDNGPGIARDLHGKVFEPFYTTKPAGSGTGLGLWLSYDIITQGHGGMLHVESEPGKLTTFVISLPMLWALRITELRQPLNSEPERGVVNREGG